MRTTSISRHTLRRRWLRIACVGTSLVVTVVCTNRVIAQFGHSDIDFALQGNKIITNKRVYDSFFPTFGISRQFTSNPGFAAESDALGTLGSRHEVVYDVLGGLMFWDGHQFLSPESDVRIRIDNNPPGSGSTFVDATSDVQLGSVDPLANRVAASSASGEVHSHVNFFLEPSESDIAFGAYGFKLAISTDSDRIEDSDPVFVLFNYGLDELDFENGLAALESLLSIPDLVGDFDQSGSLDAADIDLLTDAVLQSSADGMFDVNTDGQINTADRQHWVESLRGTYFGDANLDGEFSSTDFVAVFQLGEYEDGVVGNSTWSEGDWNGDLDFNTGDFVMAFQSGGYEQGPRARVATVPEPIVFRSLFFGIAAVSFGWRSRVESLATQSMSATCNNRDARRVPASFPRTRGNFLN